MPGTAALTSKLCDSVPGWEEEWICCDTEDEEEREDEEEKEDRREKQMIKTEGGYRTFLENNPRSTHVEGGRNKASLGRTTRTSSEI